MPSPTIRVALPGYRVDTDTNPDHYMLYADEDWVLIKQKLTGTMVVPSSSYAIIEHSLGYIPLCFVFGRVTGDRWALLQGDSADLSMNIEVNTTQLKIWNGSITPHQIEYFIFHDQMVAPGLMTKSMKYHVVGQALDPHPVLAVARAGKNAMETDDPNDFIYHSDYNTFKILATGLYEPTVPHDTSINEFTVAHGMDYAPEVIAFMKEGSVAEVMLASNVSASIGSYLHFDSVQADATNIIFRVGNQHISNDIVAHIRWFIVAA